MVHLEARFAYNVMWGPGSLNDPCCRQFSISQNLNQDFSAFCFFLCSETKMVPKWLSNSYKKCKIRSRSEMYLTVLSYEHCPKIQEGSRHHVDMGKNPVRNLSCVEGGLWWSTTNFSKMGNNEIRISFYENSGVSVIVSPVIGTEQPIRANYDALTDGCVLESSDDGFTDGVERSSIKSFYHSSCSIIQGSIIRKCFLK